jgi:hypothetical protein
MHLTRVVVSRTSVDVTAHDAPTLATLAFTQGGFYVVTGLWPLVHYPSFMAVTGPKLEGWLVKTVGLLLASIGTTLVLGARAREPRSVSALGALSAASMAGISLHYASKRRIARVYFADAIIELALTGAWTALLARAALRRRRHRASSDPFDSLER